MGKTKPCEENAFCKALPEEVRLQLCKHCIKTSFAEHTELQIDVNHPWLVLDGLIVSKANDKPNAIMNAGFFMLTPRFAPEGYADVLPSRIDISYSLKTFRYTCFTPVVVATFSVRAIDELMNDIRFLRVLFDNIQIQMNAMQMYQVFLYQKQAYDSVAYVLKLAKVHGVSGLTHEKIAELTGRSRTTVTQVMHEIALAEPELVEGL